MGVHALIRISLHTGIIFIGFTGMCWGKSAVNECISPEEEGYCDAPMDDQSEGDSNSGSGTSNSFPLTLKHVGLFILKAKEIYKVPESHIGSLIEDVSRVMELTMVHLEKQVQVLLRGFGIAMSAELKNLF